MPKYEYNSFSGHDMVAQVTIPGVESLGGVYTLGSLQTISYSINTIKSPIRPLGNMNAIDYTTGPRTIAGSLVFATFDKHVVYKLIQTINPTVNDRFAYLFDELPPIDITISLANEYGKRGRIALLGVRIVNEGQVMSINDVYTENTYQFVATNVQYLTDANGTSSYNKLTPPKIINSIKKEINALPTHYSDFEEEKIEDPLSIFAIVNNDIVSLSLSDKTITSGTYEITKSDKIRIIKKTLSNNKPLSFSLPKGNYNVVFKKDNSNEIASSLSFIVQLEDKQEKNITPFLIEYATHDSISITDYNGRKNKISIYDDNKQLLETRDIKGLNTIFTSLFTGTKYYIKTHNTDSSQSSKLCEVSTSSIQNEKYNNIKTFLNYSYNTFKKSNESKTDYEKRIFRYTEDLRAFSEINPKYHHAEEIVAQHCIILINRFNRETDEIIKKSLGEYIEIANKALPYIFNFTVDDLNKLNKNYPYASITISNYIKGLATLDPNVVNIKLQKQGNQMNTKVIKLSQNHNFVMKDGKKQITLPCEANSLYKITLMYSDGYESIPCYYYKPDDKSIIKFIQSENVKHEEISNNILKDLESDHSNFKNLDKHNKEFIAGLLYKKQSEYYIPHIDVDYDKDQEMLRVSMFEDFVDIVNNTFYVYYSTLSNYLKDKPANRYLYSEYRHISLDTKKEPYMIWISSPNDKVLCMPQIVYDCHNHKKEESYVYTSRIKKLKDELKSKFNSNQLLFIIIDEIIRYENINYSQGISFLMERILCNYNNIPNYKNVLMAIERIRAKTLSYKRHGIGSLFDNITITLDKDIIFNNPKYNGRIVVSKYYRNYSTGDLNKEHETFSVSKGHLSTHVLTNTKKGNILFTTFKFISNDAINQSKYYTVDTLNNTRFEI